MHPLSSPEVLPQYAHIPYTPLHDLSPPMARRNLLSHLSIRCRIALAITIIVTLLFGRWWYIWYEPNLELPRQPTGVIPTIPSQFRTVGLVFYGRRSRVEILDCYLKQNLKENGGLLDQVVFLARTDNNEDLHYLDRLIETADGYSRRNLTEYNGDASKVTYGQAWDVVEQGTMYIKIDDDTMFIDKDAIASLIATKIAHPEYLLVSTNTINSPRLAWLHSHLGAIHPYLPEFAAPSTVKSSNQSSWRASFLPLWEGDLTTYNIAKHPSPPHANHRWLPLPPSYGLTGTPIENVEYETTTEAIRYWAVAAQEHYSFLQNLEDDNLGLYKFDRWHMQGTRIQVNMIAIWGDDVINNGPVGDDDEGWLTEVLPERLGRAAVVDGNAIAVHYAFRHQSEGLEKTDLLARYRSYAQEMVCGNL